MLDIDLKIADSVVIDISAAATQSTGAFNLGRGGLPRNLYFIVHVEDGTDDATAKPFLFNLEVTVDNGSTWKRVATIVTDAAKALIREVPVGLNDIRPEAYPSASIDVRVTVTWDATAGTNDVTFSAYLGTPQGYPSFD